MELKNQNFYEFIEELEPIQNFDIDTDSKKIISTNQLKKIYIGYCNNVLNTYSKKDIINNRQEFLSVMRKIYGEYEIFNKKTNRSKGWSLEIKNKQKFNPWIVKL